MSMSLQGLKTGAGKFMTPVKALGEIWIDTAEKAVDLQMYSCKAYTDIAFSQLKKVPGIHNMEDAGDFFWGQIGPISEFNKQLLSDWKALVTLNTELTGNVKSAFSTSKPETVTSVLAPEEPEPESKAEPVAPITKAKRTPRAKKATATK